MSSKKSGTKSTLTKRFLWLVVALLLFLMTSVLGLLLALRSQGFRQTLMTRISQSTEKSADLGFRVDDFQLDLWAGRIEAQQLEVWKSGQSDTPFLRATRLAAQVQIASLFDDVLRVDEILVEEPILDLGAPLPEIKSEPTDGPSGRTFNIDQLRLNQAEVIGDPATLSPESWLASWRLEGVDLSGSLQAQTWRSELEKGRFFAERSDGLPLAFDLQARANGDLEGAFEVENARVDGDGLQLTARGELGGEPSTSGFDFSLGVEAGRFIPDLVARGRLDAEGRFDPQSMTGEVKVRAEGFPTSIVEPWLGRSELEAMGLKDSSLDLQADLHASPLASDPAGNPTSSVGGDSGGGVEVRAVDGKVALQWRRGKKILLDLTADTEGGRLSTDGSVDLTALRADAKLSAPGLRAEMLRPWIDRETFERLNAKGTEYGLDADLQINAAAASPVAGAIDFFWRRDSEIYLKGTATSLEVSKPSAVRWRFEGDLLPGLPGQRQLSGVWAATDWREPADSELEETLFVLEEPDLSARFRDLHERWPGLITSEISTLPFAGALTGTARLAGAVNDPTAELDLAWQISEGESVLLLAEGKPAAQSGRAELELQQFNLEQVSAWIEALGTESSEELNLAGRVDGRLEWTGSPDDFQIQAKIKGEDLREVAIDQTIDHLALEVATEGREVILTNLELLSGERQVFGEGQLTWEQPLRSASLSVDLIRPLEGLDRAAVALDLVDGGVAVRVSEIESATGTGDLTAYVPFGALAELPSLAESVPAWPVEKASGPVQLEFAFPVLELADWIEAPEMGEIQNLRAALEGQLTFGLADITSAQGQLKIPFFNLATEIHSVELSEPLFLDVGDQSLAARPFSLRADGQLFSVDKAGVRLRSPWTLDDDPSQVVETIEIAADGYLPATLLQPFLGGGIGRGNLETRITARGPLDALEARASVQGPEAEITIHSPYLTRLRQPSFQVVMRDGTFEIEDGQALLNQGEIRFSGSYAEETGLSIATQLEDVRYRLNYGLSVVASGAFDFQLDPFKEDGSTTGRLGGRLVLERGVLRRDLFLDRQVLSELLAPTSTGIAEESLLDNIELDLELATLEGIRVKNNLADLRATWSPMRVRGRLTQPVIEGSIEVQPGGYAYAFGQTVRLDEATLTFPGDPTLEPELEMVMTTSLEDPSIAREGASRFPVDFQTLQDNQPVSANDSIGRGVAAYYGDQLAGQLGGLFGASTRLNFGRPILIFNEADPSRRLTVVRDLSNYISLAASVDLATEGEQTYVLDVHDLPRLRRLIGQVFTTDESDEGAALQQIIEFGGGKDQDLSQPLISELEIQTPDVVSRSALREALEFEQGDRWRDGGDFDIEVDAAEHLRRRGFPEAEVKVATTLKGDEIEVRIEIEPGPKIEFEFLGDKPPSRSRSGITSLYRLGFYQETTLEEMRREWTRLMRADGYIEPQVEISTVDLPEGGQKVTLDGSGGRKIEPGAPIFEGVDDEVASRLAERFPGTLSRIQLARAESAADRLLLDALRVLGYPQPRILGREVSENGKVLKVELSPGPRLLIGALDIAGVSEAEVEALRAAIEIKPGDPARLDRLARAALILETSLRSRGYADARVRGKFVEMPTENLRKALFEVKAGPLQTIDEIRFEGQKVTRERWAERATGLETGEPLDPKSVARARRRLFDTRLFRSVLPSMETTEDGRSIVTFDLEEGPRYSFAYGFRWKSNDGFGVVFDALDRNAIGRGVTIGLRGLYLEDDASLRLYGAIPKIFGSQATLEMYLQGREFSEIDDLGDEIETSEIESSLQLAFPFTEQLKGRVYLRFNDRVVTAPDPFFPDLEFSVQRSNPVLGTQLFYDSRDDLFNARQGWFASADLSGSDEFLNSDFFYLRFFGQVQHFRRIATLWGQPVIWAQAWRVGVADAFRGQDVITEERFLAGGERSIRGYRDDSIGEGGILDGGEALFVLNQEIRFPIYDRVRGVVFFDAGNVWNSTQNFGDDLLSSTGLGLRAQTPVGLLRLDFAFPLDRREGDESSAIYFGFGQSF